MDIPKILLVCSEATEKEIKNIISLSPNNFRIIDVCRSGNDGLRRASILLPDVVVTEYTLTDMKGFDIAEKIEELNLCPTIIVTNPSQSAYIDDLKKDSINIFCITKPLHNLVLLHTIELAVRLSHKFYSIKQKVQSLEYQLEERKNVDIARGILMKKFHLDEAQAYKNLQKKAMDSGRTINDIAKTIIKMFEFIDKK
ncbi:MAG: ANTAR domain-containing protein [Endomicrobiaceae bacterium]|nr:ANTAR domain-containing protein [Endomicrobiaceae bacterium]